MRTVAYTQIAWLVLAAAVSCRDERPRAHTTNGVDAAGPDADTDTEAAEHSEAAVAAETHVQEQESAAKDTELDAGRAQTLQPTAAAAPAAKTKTKPAAPKLGREALGNSPLPCDLRAVLESSCQSCHARKPGALAPMALTSLEDLLAPAISQPKRSVYELVKERVHSEKAPMPPASSRRLTEAELATLDDGLNAELAAGPPTCEDGAPKQAMYPDPDPSEIEQCYPMHAYQSGDMQKPFRAATGERYGCFAFDIPWQDKAQAVSIRIQQTPIVHHWILFDGELPQGTVLVTQGDCSFGATTVYASGGVSDETVINAPPSVGLEMPSKSSGKRMQLSIHYFNMGEAVDDAFGVDICVARTPREHTAVPHTFGTRELSLPPHQATQIVRHCKPKYVGEIHMIQMIPHMHSRATRLSTIIERANGSRETLIDVPFDFNNQITYALDKVLNTGDSLTTTCYFQNDTDRTIIWGTSTEDEMCGGTITAWPAGSLSNGDTSVGVNTCLE